MDNKQRAVYEMIRGECYRFLAACFYLPKKETIGSDTFFPALINNLQQVCPAAAPSAELMQQAFSSQTEEELASEYAHLFMGPFALKAPPYGSVYLDENRIVMGPSTMETIKVYESEGLVRDAEFDELPDHIAVELEFVYYLIYRQVEALDKSDFASYQEYCHKEQEFISRFLGKWAPRLCANITNETSSAFYRSLTGCLEALLEGGREAGSASLQ
jgi:TorA maturation chaperone TorD